MTDLVENVYSILLLSPYSSTTRLTISLHSTIAPIPAYNIGISSRIRATEARGERTYISTSEFFRYWSLDSISQFLLDELELLRGEGMGVHVSIHGWIERDGDVLREGSKE